MKWEGTFKGKVKGVEGPGRSGAKQELCLRIKFELTHEWGMGEWLPINNPDNKVLYFLQLEDKYIPNLGKTQIQLAKEIISSVFGVKLNLANTDSLLEREAKVICSPQRTGDSKFTNVKTIYSLEDKPKAGGFKEIETDELKKIQALWDSIPV